MQVTWQVDPPLQVTLPLFPTVVVQVEPLPQSMLQEASQLPVHVLWSEHARVQLPVVPHVLCANPHADPGGHEQLAPVQDGGFVVVPPSLPQA